MRSDDVRISSVRPALAGRVTSSILAVALAVAAAPSTAYEFDAGGAFKASLSTILTVGTAIRTESPNPAVLGPLATARVGLPTGQLNGNVGGGGNLNFDAGDPISTVAKALVGLELKRNAFGPWQDAGVFARAVAWYDYELSEGNQPYGNTINGFAQRVPIGDHGFAPSAKFGGVELLDVYAFGKYALDSQASLDLRVGRQTVNWGVSQFVAGGINVVNAIDGPAALRPGAILPDEGRVPVGMVYANYDSNAGWGVDGWYPWEFRPTGQNGCGTFFVVSGFSPDGCFYASVLGDAGVNDPTALATGLYAHRADDIDARSQGQWGLSARYRAAGFDTEFRAYAINFHSRSPVISVRNPDVAGTYGTFNPAQLANPAANTRLTDPNGLKYQMQYVEDIHLYGVSFDSAPRRGSRIFGEISYRPNQPFGLNAADLINAFMTRSPKSALQLDRNVLALPPGALFEGFDRYGMGWATLGGAQVLPGALGAERATLAAEVGWSHVFDLPNPGNLRYGRSDDYGTAQVAGGAPCVDRTLAQKNCALDGFITPDSWGVRLRAAATYPGAFLGATLTPAVFFARDVGGYSLGNVFVEGRWILRPTLRAEWKDCFAEVQYTATGGGAYNNQIDRDFIAFFAGMRF